MRFVNVLTAFCGRRGTRLGRSCSKQVLTRPGFDEQKLFGVLKHADIVADGSQTVAVCDMSEHPGDQTEARSGEGAAERRLLYNLLAAWPCF